MFTFGLTVEGFLLAVMLSGASSGVHLPFDTVDVMCITTNKANGAKFLGLSLAHKTGDVSTYEDRAYLLPRGVVSRYRVDTNAAYGGLYREEGDCSLWMIWYPRKTTQNQCYKCTAYYKDMASKISEKTAECRAGLCRVPSN